MWKIDWLNELKATAACYTSAVVAKSVANLGSGHLPLSRSSATNLTSTDLQRSSSDSTASWVIVPSFSFDAPVDRVTNENCSSVLKQDFANDSRSFRLDSVSENQASQHRRWYILTRAVPNRDWEYSGEYEYFLKQIHIVPRINKYTVLLTLIKHYAVLTFKLLYVQMI